MSETDRSGARPRSAVTALLLAVPLASGPAVARVRSRAARLSGRVLIVAVVLARALLSALGRAPGEPGGGASVPSWCE